MAWHSPISFPPRSHRAIWHPYASGAYASTENNPHFSALNPRYPRLIFYATGASATIRMLPALNKQCYRHLCVNLYATSANHFRCVAQPQQCIRTKRTLPALNPVRYGRFRINATSVYASICELPAPIIYRDCFSTSTKKWAFCQIFHTNFIPSNWYHKIQ